MCIYIYDHPHYGTSVFRFSEGVNFLRSLRWLVDVFAAWIHLIYDPRFFQIKIDVRPAEIAIWAVPFVH